MPYISKYTNKLEVIDLGSEALLGEGIFADNYHGDARVYWVDILGSKIYMYHTECAELHEFKYPGKYPSIIIPTDEEFEYIVASDKELHLWTIDETNSSNLICKIDVDENIRLNDGKCDPSGRLWIGTLDKLDRPNRAHLYRFDFDDNCHELEVSDQRAYLQEVKDFPVSLSNGIGWNKAGDQMFYIDTPERRLDIYNYDPKNGILCNKIKSIDLSQCPGVPDGLTVDDADRVFIAMWNGSCILRVTPITNYIEIFIKLPVSRPTSCVFVARDLYITTAKVADEENSGRVFIARDAGAGSFSKRPIGPFEIFRD